MGCQMSNQATAPKYKANPTLFISTDEAVLANPQNSPQMSSKYLFEHNLNRSILHYQQLVQKNPNLLHFQIDGLGNIDDEVGCFDQKVQEWYQVSLQARAIKGHPLDALSLCYTLKQDSMQGVNWYLSMLQNHPKAYQLYFGLGNLYYKADLYQEAQSNYRKSFQLKPSFQKAYQTIAALYCYKLCDYVQAKQWAQMSIKLKPANPYSLLIYAFSYEDIQQRIKFLYKILNKNQKYSRAINALGWAYYQKGHYETALDYFQKSHETNENYYAAMCGIAMASNKLQNYSQAVKWSQKLLLLNPEHHEPYLIMGDISLNKQNIQEAQFWFKQCIKFSSTHDMAQCELAKIRLIKNPGATQEVYQHLNNIVSQNISYIHCREELGKLSIELGNKEQGLWHLTQVLAVNPTNHALLVYLGDYYQRNENYEKAIQSYLACLPFEDSTGRSYHQLKRLYILNKQEHMLDKLNIIWDGQENS